MIKATQITLERATGRVSQLKSVTFTGDNAWSEANMKLIEWKLSLDDNECIDIDFTVIFEDGFKYNGSLELYGRGFMSPRLNEHMKQHIKTYAGLLCQPQYSKKEYEEYIKIYSQESRAELVRILETYEIG